MPASNKKETTSVPVLEESPVSKAQAKKAVDALLAHASKVQQKKEETELVQGKEELVWLVIATKSIPQGKLKGLKPKKINLTTPLVDPRTNSICLLVKDPQREYKDLMEKSNIKFISRVVGVEKLRGKFKPFEARRALCKDHGLFLADERIVPLLPKLLGKIFFDAKKQPIPVNLTKKDLKGELERAISATYFHMTQGNCATVKFSTISHTPSQTLQNLLTALPQIIACIPGGWASIQSLNIKTSTSVSLPIWQCDLGEGEGGRWEGIGEEAWEQQSDSNASVDELVGEDDEGFDSDEVLDEEEEEIIRKISNEKKMASKKSEGGASKKKNAAVEASPSAGSKKRKAEALATTTPTVVKKKVPEQPPKKKTKPAKKA